MLLCGAMAVNGQNTIKKARLYGEVGLGFGKTLFFGNTKSNLNKGLGGTFKPGSGNNLMMAFYVAPEKWKGFGIGSRIKGTFGMSVEGDFGDSYIFNYYNLSISSKYYLLKREFNKGLYVRAGVGFGQFTSKRDSEEDKVYKHQYGIGGTYTGSVGWSFPIKKVTLNIEAEFEYSNRGGTIDGLGDASFGSGQAGGNIYLAF